MPPVADMEIKVMNKPIQAALVTLILTALTPVFAQNDERKRDKEPLFSVPVTQTTIENFLTRAVEDMARRYELDDEQFELADEILKKRVVGFIRGNRVQMQKLIQEFTEVQTGFEPPEVDFVTEWATRALPLMEKARDELGEIVGDMRDFMTDDQRLQLDAEWSAFNVGFGMLSGKVDNWANGGYDPEVEFVGNFDQRRQQERAERRQRILAMKQAEEEFLIQHGLGDSQSSRDTAKIAAARTPDRDPWTLEVEAFAKRYELTLEQRTQAFRLLHKYRTRRDSYLIKSSTKQKLSAAAAAMAEAKTDDEKAAAFERVAAIDKPVENIHQMLSDALDKLPTRAQRAKAGKRDLDKKSAAKSDERATEIANNKPPE